MTFSLIPVLVTRLFFCYTTRYKNQSDLLWSPVVSHAWRTIYQTYFAICHSLATRHSFLHVQIHYSSTLKSRKEIQDTFYALYHTPYCSSVT